MAREHNGFATNHRGLKTVMQTLASLKKLHNNLPRGLRWFIEKVGWTNHVEYFLVHLQGPRLSRKDGEGRVTGPPFKNSKILLQKM